MHTFKLLIRKDQEKVAFMWNGQQYSLTVFLQDYINSHHRLRHWLLHWWPSVDATLVTIQNWWLVHEALLRRISGHCYFSQVSRGPVVRGIWDIPWKVKEKLMHLPNPIIEEEVQCLLDLFGFWLEHILHIKMRLWLLSPMGIQVISCLNCP